MLPSMKERATGKEEEDLDERSTCYPESPHSSHGGSFSGEQETLEEETLEEEAAEEEEEVVNFKPGGLSLTKARAVKLQMELMAQYGGPAFQNQLHALARTHEPGSSKFRSGLCKLVRRVQLDVIPRYGFSASDEGVESMLVLFRSLTKDPDIEVNGVVINDLLQVKLPPMETNHSNRIIEKPLSKYRLLDMLRCQLIEFSQVKFQMDVKELKKCADYNSGRVFDPAKPLERAFEDPEGYFHLEGRADLAFTVHKFLLPRYGFEPSKEGVKDMIRHCAPFVQDPEVANLLDCVNEKLGMSAAACRRFRQLIAQLT